MTEQKIFSKYPLPTNEFTPEFQRELSRAKESSLSQIKDAMTTSSTKKPKESGAKNEKPSTDSNASLHKMTFDAIEGQIGILITSDEGENISVMLPPSWRSVKSITIG